MNFTIEYCLTHTDRTDQIQRLLSIYVSSLVVKLELFNSISYCWGTGSKCKCNFSWGYHWVKSSKGGCVWLLCDLVLDNPAKLETDLFYLLG